MVSSAEVKNQGSSNILKNKLHHSTRTQECKAYTSDQWEKIHYISSLNAVFTLFISTGTFVRVRLTGQHLKRIANDGEVHEKEIS